MDTIGSATGPTVFFPSSAEFTPVAARTRRQRRLYAPWRLFQGPLSARDDGHFQDQRAVVEIEQPGNIAAADLGHRVFLQTQINVALADVVGFSFMSLDGGQAHFGLVLGIEYDTMNTEPELFSDDQYIAIGVCLYAVKKFSSSHERGQLENPRPLRRRSHAALRQRSRLADLPAWARFSYLERPDRPLSRRGRNRRLGRWRGKTLERLAGRWYQSGAAGNRYLATAGHLIACISRTQHFRTARSGPCNETLRRLTPAVISELLPALSFALGVDQRQRRTLLPAALPEMPWYDG
jgi:hypothetical protein